MALIHYLYVGHFILEDGFVRLQEGHPLCERTVDMVAVSELLERHFGKGTNPDSIPSNWGLSISSEYIVCNRYGSNQVLEFITDYAKQTNACIFDMGCLTLLNPDDVQSG